MRQNREKASIIQDLPQILKWMDMLSDRGIIMNAKPKIAIGVLAVLLVAGIVGLHMTTGGH